MTENEMLQEIACGANFSYVLGDEVKILPTEFKVMQDRNVNCLVRCMRMKYNGHDSLFYHTGGMKVFANELQIVDADRATDLVVALLKSIVDLKNVGFLSCVNIVSSLQKIYLEGHSNQVRLVYLPINQHLHADDVAFENTLRGLLVRKIDDLLDINERLRSLRGNLINVSIPLDELIRQTLGGVEESLDNTLMGDAPRKLKLSAVDSPGQFELIVDQNEYRIGKSPVMDGVIKYNMYIGRVHCKILRTGDVFLVVDLDSKNGTYLNGIKISPQRAYELHDGDYLTLANSSFLVTILEGGAQ